MIIADEWVLHHLKTRMHGNTSKGREFVRRVAKENPVVIFRCDLCGAEEVVTPHTQRDRLRACWNKAEAQEVRWGNHQCPQCARASAAKKRGLTISTAEWKAKNPPACWQQDASPEKLQRWKDSIRAAQDERYRRMTPEERKHAVLKQWDTMTAEQKKERAFKIGEASKELWASYSKEEREERVRNMIKGLPRSQASEDLKEALIETGLYVGFESEVCITGFVADEADTTRKLVLEFYGDYYHCNPRTYSADFLNTTTRKTAAQQWHYDRRRLAAFRKNGFRTLVVWESNWNLNRDAELSRVKTFLEAADAGH